MGVLTDSLDMKGSWYILILIPAASLVAGECDDLPNGDSCEGLEGKKFADPDDCVSYYKCVSGCAEHNMCERNFLFDDERGYCNYPTDVDCGDRTCEDPKHCVTTPPTPPTPTPDCGHLLDCTKLDDGWYSDPYKWTRGTFSLRELVAV